MYNITAVVEKENEFGQLKIEAARLVDLGGNIAHTITCREGDYCINHCNLIVEFKDLKTMSYTEVNRLENTEEKAIKIRQATEQGYTLCEVGGGSRFGISDKPNKARKSNRERKDLPNLDNGEYP